MIGPHFELNRHWRPVQDLHRGICVCLPDSFLLLLATQAQLHKTVDSPRTADEKLKLHIPRLLSLQLISKNGVHSFLLKHLVSGGGGENKTECSSQRKGEIVSEKERERERRTLKARRERGSDWEGGRAHLSSQLGCFQNTPLKASVNSWLLFLDLLCLPVWPYNIIHLVYRFFSWAFLAQGPGERPWSPIRVIV